MAQIKPSNLLIKFPFWTCYKKKKSKGNKSSSVWGWEGPLAPGVISQVIVFLLKPRTGRNKSPTSLGSPGPPLSHLCM
jgi:hypothetical protein